MALDRVAGNILRAPDSSGHGGGFAQGAAHHVTQIHALHAGVQVAEALAQVSHRGAGGVGHGGVDGEQVHRAQCHGHAVALVDRTFGRAVGAFRPVGLVLG